MKLGRGWRLMAGLVLASVFACAPAAASAKEPRCRGNVRVAKRCYWIRGEFAMSGDSAFIVDRDDNGQWVIIRTPRDWPDLGPDNLARFYGKVVRSTDVGEAAVRGAFEVCPIPKATDWHGVHACIETAKHLRRVSSDWMSPAQKRLHDRSIAADKKDRARDAAAQKKFDEEYEAAQKTRRLEQALGLPPALTPP